MHPLFAAVAVAASVAVAVALAVGGFDFEGETEREGEASGLYAKLLHFSSAYAIELLSFFGV